MTSPSARTVDAIAKLGYLVDTVERWMPFTNKRRDLYGFGDLLAVIDGRTVILQVTAGCNNALARVRKILVEKRFNAIAWLGGRGNEIQIWGWRRLPSKKTRKLWYAARWRIFLLRGELEVEKLPDV